MSIGWNLKATKGLHSFLVYPTLDKVGECDDLPVCYLSAGVCLVQSVSHHCHLSSVLSLTATAAASNHGQPSGLRLTIDTLVTTHNLRLNYHLSLLVKVEKNVACLVYNMTLYN